MEASSERPERRTGRERRHGRDRRDAEPIERRVPGRLNRRSGEERRCVTRRAADRAARAGRFAPRLPP
jgi:hypothetical protein